jgi:formate dehydrogenase gamma subunit
LAPTCTSCHGIHTIKHTPGPDANEAEARLVRSTCIACHGSEALMGNLGVAPARVSSYDASYHGLVHKRGEAAVADCASCHGVHAILPSSNPRSMVAPERLQETCGTCHPGAGERFVQTPVHFIGDMDNADTGTLIVIWVKRIYWALLISVLGGMLIHNLIIVGWYMRRKWREERKTRLRRRFTAFQVVQHAMLVTSFFVLVITGFMLAYPDSWWSHLLAQAGVGEWARRYIHRGAGIVLMVASLIHLWWILFTPYGRAEVKRIAPKMRDVHEVMQNMRFHLGSSEQRAAFAKYDYPAKAEYWALVWGTVVMIITGLILWFPVFTSAFAPLWILKVAEVIHLFEAWLATLAILIFHFFYVFGHPEVYPFNFAMFHGGMREEFAELEHPAWADEEQPRAI